jgi:TolB-like protein
MSEKPPFFSELKRRNVYRVAVAYAVVAWLLIQIATQVFPFFEIPNWAVRLVVVLLLLGFPVALILAWAFEITPEGIKRTDDVTPQESIASRRGRKLIAFTAVAAVIAAGLFAFQWMKSHSRSSVEPQTDGLAGARPSIPEKSIAVLPFENLSSDKENAYFVAGIQDEILTRLAKIGALKVISRSSTQQYQSKPGNLREIAQQLGVVHLLEGSVQKAGQVVHVNVQLIRAATDEHLWAESYDRTLDNIFGVEGEIAQMVAEALHARLTGAEAKVLAQKPTNNPAAYDAYLRGAAQSRQEGEAAAKAAQVSFAEAVRLDPQFAAAWAALSRTDSQLFFVYDATAARQAEAERALAEAFRLQPDLAETQLARAYLQYWVRRDYTGALELMRQLRTSWPNNAEALEAMALISARLGQWKQGLDYMQQSMALNPKDLATRLEALELALAVRDFALAIRLADEGLRTWPGNSALLGLKASAFQARGQLDEAQAVLAEAKFDPTTGDAGTIAMTYQVSLRRDPAGALKLLDSYPKAADEGDPKFLPYWAVVQKVAGRNEEARAIFTRVRDMVAPLVKTQPENPGFLGILSFALAELDQRDDVFKTLDQFAAASAGDARSGALGEELRARVFAHFGDKDRAIISLEHLLSAPADGLFAVPVTPAILRLDPMFDPLRGDPRFEKLCQEKAK